MREWVVYHIDIGGIYYKAPLYLWVIAQVLPLLQPTLEVWTALYSGQVWQVKAVVY